MKAIVWTQYGPPEFLQLRDVEKPTPAENEVLVKVYSATVTLGDCELRGLKTPLWLRVPMRIIVGIDRPRRRTILGQELAGVVEAAGAQVTRFKPGDAVFGPCLLRLGAHAEYACLPESYLQAKPDSLSFDEAATIPTGGINGLYFLRQARLQPGESVLINGAGGSIGTYAVQIARAFGAEVTAVDHAAKLDMLHAIGAQHVIDYTRQDFTRSGKTYDAIIDVVGKAPFSGSLKALNPGGRFILGNPGIGSMLRKRLTRLTAGKQVIVAVANYTAEAYALLLELMQAGKVKAVIDRVYPLEQTAAAHAYVDVGHKQGNLIIRVVQDQPA